jgi:hypothetical protein
MEEPTVQKMACSSPTIFIKNEEANKTFERCIKPT